MQGLDSFRPNFSTRWRESPVFLILDLSMSVEWRVNDACGFVSVGWVVIGDDSCVSLPRSTIWVGLNQLMDFSSMNCSF